MAGFSLGILSGSGALSSYTIEVLVVAGGGGGGGVGYSSMRGGGGGGGGGAIFTGYTITPSISYPITIGAGGSASNPGSNVNATNGGNSIFDLISTLGGGFGGSISTSGNALSLPGNGGSGGGGCSQTQPGGLGTVGQGGNGGKGFEQSTNYIAAGGGGKGANAADSTISGPSPGGIGGNFSTQFGTSYGQNGFFSGGGGASCSPGTASAGGNGGGGAGTGTNGVSGTVNTGGGGGGGQRFSIGGAGGSGIVLLRYLGAQRGTGGTVSSFGGYTIHSFTTSGNYIG